MKAQPTQCSARVQQEFGLRADQFKIGKHHLENGDYEMAACFSKLKDLVPTVPSDKKLSKVQLLQHVIDYILDLEVTLDSPCALQSAAGPATDRQPLAESLHLNTLTACDGSLAASAVDTASGRLDTC